MMVILSRENLTLLSAELTVAAELFPANLYTICIPVSESLSQVIAVVSVFLPAVLRGFCCCLPAA